MAQYDTPQKVYVTGEMAGPSQQYQNYVMTQEPRPNLLRRALGAIGAVFEELLPDRGGKATVADDALVIKTSPTIWTYELFRAERERRAILREIEEMLHNDPRVQRANRVFAETAVRKGLTVTVTCGTSENIGQQAQDVITQLMHDCQINAKLASWARILLKDGDLFLNPVIDIATNRIKNIKRLPAIGMQRCENMWGTFDDLDEAFQQIDPISEQVIEKFSLWMISHIRWNHEEGMLYGSSQYLQIRGYWKKLDMTEKDQVIRRRTRAPQRLLHKIGAADSAGNPADIDAYRQRNRLDPSKGQICTDFYGNGQTDIKVLDGDAHIDDIKDIEYLQDVYAIGTGVPLHLLGFGRNVNRDIVKDQERKFREDTQELRDLLEFGDSSPYSGLRPIMEFALSLQGIDPRLVEFNFGWFADDDETASDRVDRVVKLRGAQPNPLVSKRLALQTIQRDLNLESAAALEAELEEQAREMAQDRQDQKTLAGEINPEKPVARPLSHSTVASDLTDMLTDSLAVALKRLASRPAQVDVDMIDRPRKKKEHSCDPGRPLPTSGASPGWRASSIVRR